MPFSKIFCKNILVGSNYFDSVEFILAGFGRFSFEFLHFLTI